MNDKVNVNANVDNIELVFEILYQRILDKIFYLAKKHTEIREKSEIQCPFGREKCIERISWAGKKLFILEYYEKQRLSESTRQPYTSTRIRSLGSFDFQVDHIIHISLPHIHIPFDNLEAQYQGSFWLGRSPSNPNFESLLETNSQPVISAAAAAGAA